MTPYVDLLSGQAIGRSVRSFLGVITRWHPIGAATPTVVFVGFC